MAKKHWIYIKRGLSEDPKHRAAMGECVWLYMHIIDRADWETGIAYDWKDKQESAEMGMPVDTLRWQRNKLEEADYIRCTQKQHGQDIRIMEWRNPRDYSSEIKNPRVEDSNELQPSKPEGLNQGLNQGSNQVPGQVKTPSSDSKSKPSPNKIVYENDLPVEWYITHNLPIPEDLNTPAQLEAAAIKAFESALQTPANWQWYSTRGSDEKTWKDFRCFIVKLYVSDPDCFTKYQTWRNTPYMKGTMSNLAIKRNPENFPASWSDFCAGSAMYGRSNNQPLDSSYPTIGVTA